MVTIEALRKAYPLLDMVDQSRRPKELVISSCTGRTGGLVWWCLQSIAGSEKAAEAQSSWPLVTFFSKRWELVLNSQHLSALSSAGSCWKSSDFPLSFLTSCLLVQFLPVSGKIVWLTSASSETGMQDL